MIIAFYLFYKHTLLYQWESGRLVNKFFETIGKLGGKWAHTHTYINIYIFYPYEIDFDALIEEGI